MYVCVPCTKAHTVIETHSDPEYRGISATNHLNHLNQPTNHSDPENVRISATNLCRADAEERECDEV